MVSFLLPLIQALRHVNWNNRFDAGLLIALRRAPIELKSQAPKRIKTLSDSQTPDRAFQVQSYESKQLITRYWRDRLRPYAGLMTLAFIVMMIEGSALGALSYLIEPLFDKDGNIDDGICGDRKHIREVIS